MEHGNHTQITGAVVNDIDRLLAQGVGHAVIAAELTVSEYVVGVIAGDKLRVGRPPLPDRPGRRVSSVCRAVDAATIRMIERMLQVGILNQSQIAREAGVSASVVKRVAAGKRLAVSKERPYLFKDLGERFLPAPIYCSGCGAKLSIVPSARACWSAGASGSWC